MNHILEDIKKFRELLNQTPTQLNEMFNYDQKKGGQTVPPQDKLGIRPAQGVAKHPDDYKDMMTNPDMDHVKKAYAAGGPKGTLPEDDNKAFMKDIVDEGDELEEVEQMNENQQVSIIGYNSAYQPLEQAAKDPKNKRTVNVVKLGMDTSGAPELTFTDTDGSNYKARWNQQYGWVADFD
jgi:hypothetical protein